MNIFTFTVFCKEILVSKWCRPDQTAHFAGPALSLHCLHMSLNVPETGICLKQVNIPNWHVYLP